MDIRCKAKENGLKSMTPEKLGKKKNPNRNIHGSPLGKRNRQNLLRKLGTWGGGEKGEQKRRRRGERRREHKVTGESRWGKDRRGEQGKRYLA